jgi:hypothetical protein
MRNRRKPRPARNILLLGSVFAVGAVLTVLYWPPTRRSFVHTFSGKTRSYEDAVKEIQTLISSTPANIRSECAVQLFEHERPTEKVFVLIHGLSNCPAQFTKLGRQLFERGHNVLIPRIPYHGEQNRLATDWGALTAEDMLDAGNQAADLALALGSTVIVAGLSINGTTAAWMAQNRSDLGRTVLLAPFLSPAAVPAWAGTTVERLLLRLPNMFLWWDPRKRANFDGPPYVYPRFPTRVIGETMLLGREVLHESQDHAPRCASILVVTTGADKAADNRMTAELVSNWRRSRSQGIQTFEFPAADGVPHDFIDPNQPDQKTSLVYPTIIALLEK